MRGFTRHLGVVVLALFFVAGCNSDAANGDGTPDWTGENDNAVSSGEDGNAVSSQCDPGQTLCQGQCRDLEQDPDNCGECGRSCGSEEACVGGQCVTDCPGDLSKCGNQCVDLEWNGDHCGECGRSCGAKEVCTQGDCESSSGTYTRTQGACKNGGPPIVNKNTPGRSKARCSGKLARKTFRWAICSCDAIDFGNGIETDAFDSSRSSYQSGSVGGSIGSNGGFHGGNTAEIRGSVWTSSQQGLEIGNGIEIGQEVHSNGRVFVGNSGEIAKDAYVGDDIEAGNSLSIGETLHIDPDGEVVGDVEWADKKEQPVDVDTVCKRCSERDRIPVEKIVSEHAGSNNDNDKVGLDPDAFSGSNSRTFDLPCGEYYVNGIEVDNSATIRARGNTALYIDGDIDIGNSLTLKPVPGATLDVFVSGNVYVGNSADIGSTRYPSATRLYVGGSEGVGFGNSVDIGANVYAIPGGVHTGNSLELYGALYVQRLDVGNSIDVHYDRDVLEAGDKCPDPDRSGEPDIDGGEPGGGGDAGDDYTDTGDPGSGDEPQCRDKGASCSADGDCCAPMVCDEGTCASVECQVVGDPCESDSDCCTGTCASTSGSSVCTGS